MRASRTGVFGAPAENDNGRKGVEFCAERGLCVGNTYFENKSLYKYAWVARGQDGGKEHDRSGTGEEGYAAFCAGCEGSERNGMRHLRSSCCTVYSQVGGDMD